MRFLVISKSKTPLPPEMAIGILDAMIAWANRYKASGKLEDIWAYAGSQGGGGIANVESPEEVDAIMAEFPLAVFSDTEVIPIVELDGSLQRGKRALQAMMAGTGQPSSR